MAEDKNDKSNDTTDGGRHDVTRDGETGKTAKDLDPKKYGEDNK